MAAVNVDRERSRSINVHEGPAMNFENLLYTAKVHTTGGRDGASRSSDGRLDVKLSSPGTRAAAPIRSNCSLLVGWPVLSARWRLRPAK